MRRSVRLPSVDPPPGEFRLGTGITSIDVQCLRDRLWNLLLNVETELEYLELAATCIAECRPIEGVWLWLTSSDGRELAPSIAFGDLSAAVSTPPLRVDPRGSSTAQLKRFLISSSAQSIQDTNWTGMKRPHSADAIEVIPLKAGTVDFGQLVIFGYVESIRIELLEAAHAVSRAVQYFRNLDRARRATDAAEGVLETAPLPIIRLSERGDCIGWNRSVEDQFGWPRWAGRPRPISDLLKVSDGEMASFLRETRRDARSVSRDFIACSDDGRRLEVLVSCAPAPGPASGPAEFLLAVSDRTATRSCSTALELVTDALKHLSGRSTGPALEVDLVSTIGVHTHAESVTIWKLSKSREKWVLAAEWPLRNKTDIRGSSADSSLGLREGILGRVRESGRSEWFRVAKLGDVIAGRERHHGTAEGPIAFGLPVLVDEDVTSVILCDFEHDPAGSSTVIQSLEAVASLFGHFLSRHATIQALQELQEARRQSRKMEAVGLLTGGIAHDLNNTLMVISGNCELAERKGAPAREVAEAIAAIRMASERATALIRDLSLFQRKSPQELTVVNVNDCLKGSEQLVRRVIHAGIKIEIVLAQEVYPARVDRIDLEQAVLNLVINARDAIPEGGTICLATENVTISLADARSDGRLKAGEFVCLTVADTGCGMDQTTIARTSEPFFTTKPPGQGTGMGLTNVRRTVQEAGGFMTIVSQRDAGTIVRLFLPRVSAGIAPRAVDSPPCADPHGTETIVVVEDDEPLRNILQRVLEIRGYRVFAMSDGQSALDFLNNSGERIDLLLADDVMSGIRGRSVIHQAQRHQPLLPAILITGYHDNASAGGQDTDSTHHVLLKPFKTDQLAHLVRRALDFASGQSPGAGCPA